MEQIITLILAGTMISIVLIPCDGKRLHIPGMEIIHHLSLKMLYLKVVIWFYALQILLIQAIMERLPR